MPRAVLWLFLPLLLLTACHDPEWNREFDWNVDSIPGTETAVTPFRWETGRYGGVWRDTYAEDPKSFNPFSNLDGSYTLVTNLVLDYLFDYDLETKEWSGNLVESYQVITDSDADRMELRCHLRENIFWSDGVQMTADDVVWYFNNIENNAEIYPLGEQGLYINMPDGSREKYRIQQTGKFDFRYIFPRIVSEPLLVVNTGTIVPRHIWEPVLAQGKKAVEAFWGVNTKPEELVGNGAFLLESISQGERIVFKRNPNYWKKDDAGQQLPYIDKIILSYTPDSNAELLRFQKGETDGYPLRGQDLLTLLPDSGKGKYDVWNGGASSTYTALLFNQNREALSPAKYALFTDIKFKQAISCLVDRETIINQTCNGLAEPQYSAFAENNRYYDTAACTPYSYNPERAAALLEEAGYLDTDGDGIREDPSGNPISFTILTASTDPVTHDYLNIIITDMEKAGIKGILQPADFNVVVQKLLHTYDWDCYLAGMSLPTFPEQWYNIWLSSGNLHYWHPKQQVPDAEWEKSVDTLYSKLIYTYDQNQIRENYSIFQKTIMDELAIIPIFRRYSFMAVTSKWENINWNSYSSTGDGYRRIFLKEDVQK